LRPSFCRAARAGSTIEAKITDNKISFFKAYPGSECNTTGRQRVTPAPRPGKPLAVLLLLEEACARFGRRACRNHAMVPPA
jgi:hypothetical protein